MNPLDLFKLEGKVALVTGSGRGIGKDLGTRGAKNLRHQLGVELVHLAPVGRDMDAWRLHGSG